MPRQSVQASELSRRPWAVLMVATLQVRPAVGLEHDVLSAARGRKLAVMNGGRRVCHDRLL